MQHDTFVRAISFVHSLEVPQALRIHLETVHGVCSQIVEGLFGTWPCLVWDAESTLLGAALHDIGKVMHPEEIFSPGNKHCEAGYQLARRLGVPERVARMCRTHERWHEQDAVEDLVVSLADIWWRQVSEPDLEWRLCGALARRLQTDPAQTWDGLQRIWERIV